MSEPKGYGVEPFGGNRQMVAATAAVGRERNTIHFTTEVDITEPRRLIAEHPLGARVMRNTLDDVRYAEASSFTADHQQNATTSNFHQIANS